MSFYGATTPAFSDAEFERERRSLDEVERRKLRYDLYGSPDDDDTNRLQETPILISTSLRLLEEAIDALPEEEKQSYLVAKENVPELIEEESPPLGFLRCESFDVWAAAKRLCAYWALRMRFFGPERALLPMTLDGAMREDFDVYVKHAFIYPLEDDIHDRVVILWDRMRASSVPREIVLRSCFYVFSTLNHRPEFGLNGFIGISNYQGCSLRKDYDRSLTKQLAELVFVSGSKVKSFHLCTGPGRSVLEILFPVIRSFLGTFFRQRMMMHSGSASDILPYFEDYGLTETHVRAIYGLSSRRLALGQSWIYGQRQLERTEYSSYRQGHENAQQL